MSPTSPRPRGLALAALTALTSLLSSVATAQSATQSSCPSSVKTSVPSPSVLSGFESRLVATDLTSPRGAIFDSSGHLLVVEKNKGITALTLQDDGGSCVVESDRRTVVDDDDLNHGILISPSNTTLYASSPEAVYSWSYNPSNASITGPRTTVVNNMTTEDHTTRTLLIPNSMNQTRLVVTRGSTSNIDPEALDLSTGHSTIKAFDISNFTSDSDPFDYNTDGELLGWGLRNDVGIDEHPSTGRLYAVENSADQVMRMGDDIHENNPAEKMNFIGYLQNGSDPSYGQANNFGYPSCFAAWNNTAIPQFGGQVGQQFVAGSPNSTLNDTTCMSDFVAPAQVFEAHMAPLDVKFDNDGGVAWVSFHGSWDRDDPSGYKVGSVSFDKTTGMPMMPSNSTTALTDVVANMDNSKCPDECFRPVGLAFDSVGRAYFTSDTTGEVYVVSRATTSGSGSDSSGSDSSGSVQGVTPSVSAGQAAATSPSSSGMTATSSAGAVMGKSVESGLLGGVLGGLIWVLGML